MKKKERCKIVLAFSLCFIVTMTLTGCGGGGGSSVTPSVTPAVTLASLAITPANPSVVVGASQTLTLTGTNSDGTTAYITPTTQVIWTSSNPAVAMVVEGGGAVIGLAPGVVTITVTIGSISGSTSVRIPTPTSLTFPVGTNPTSIAIDASGNAWITNFGSNNVSVLSSTGTLLNTIPVGTGPVSIAIDDISVLTYEQGYVSSGNVWVVNNGSNNVTELSPSGTVLGTFAVGNGPRGIFIDGERNVWVVNHGDNTVTALSPSSGAVLVTYTVGNGPFEIAVDVSGSTWVTNFGDSTLGNTVTELGANGAVLGTFTVGSGPRSVCIDPARYVWVTNSGNDTTPGNTVTELSPSGVVMGTYTVGSSPRGVAINIGGNVWVANYGTTAIPGNTITELTGVELSSLGLSGEEFSSPGAVLGTFTVGNNPADIAIDASGNVWVVNYGSNTVTVWKGASTPGYQPFVALVNPV